MNAKRKGSRNEREIRQLVEVLGGKLTRAGGSLGMWDLLGYWNKRPVYIQAKTNRRIPKSERLDLQGEFQHLPPNSLALEAVRYDGGAWRIWSYDGKYWTEREDICSQLAHAKKSLRDSSG